MKRHLWGIIIGILLIIRAPVYGQIGHGTSDPSKASVVEMLSPSKGLLIPRVELTGLTSFNPIQGENGMTNLAKTNSLLVYNTASAGTAPNNVTPGYYYWTTDGTTGKWNRLLTDRDALKAALPKFFYMPSIIMPTDPSQVVPGESSHLGGMYTIDLHARYATQFGSPMAKNGSATTLPIIPANELNYYITWYDNTLFDNVQVTDAGILTYQVLGSPADEGSFMNIVFEVRETPSSP